jgi:peptidoglycan/LPS O-acetylase OafA/YrhL
LVIWGVVRWGFVPLTLLSIAITLAFAVFSWWAIEKHALKMKSLGLRQRKGPVPLLEPMKEQT